MKCKIEIVFLILLIALISCRDKGDTDKTINVQDKETKPEEGKKVPAIDSKLPVELEKLKDVDTKQLVNMLLEKKDKKERIRIYIQLSEVMDNRANYHPKSRIYFQELANEIVKKESVELIEELEGRLKDKSRKAKIWRSVMLCENEEKKKLLKKWSVNNPEVMILLPHHPDGYEMLFKIVEDKNLHGNERAMGVIYLQMFAEKRTVERLKKYIEDKTVVGLQGAKELTTLGKIVQDTILKVGQNIHNKETEIENSQRNMEDRLNEYFRYLTNAPPISYIDRKVPEYERLVKIGIKIVPTIIIRLKKYPNSTVPLVCLLQDITKKKFKKKTTGDNVGTIRMGKNMIKWWSGAEVETRKDFKRLYRKLKYARKNNKKAVHSLYEEIEKLGILALPLLIDKLRKGDKGTLKIISELTDKKVKVDATLDECLVWWERNKEFYKITK